MKPWIRPSDKGILNATAGRQKFTLTRYLPAPELSWLVENYWIVQWDLTHDAPYQQTILSYPSVNLAFETDHAGRRALIYGVPKSTFTRQLHGTGHVLGVKFRPGGFYPFLHQPVSLLTGQTHPFTDLFRDDEAQKLEQRIFSLDDGEQMAQEAEQFLLTRLPSQDEDVDRVNRMIETVIDDRQIRKVDDLAERFDLGIRTLQRLFQRYVGVSPKWVIQRYRLQEAALLIEERQRTDWIQFAQELGFYDQAHFIRTFKAMTGQSPEAYVKDIEP